MRTAAIFAAAAALLPSVFAQRAQTVTGIQGAGLADRREITELARDEDAFNLYVLALNRFQNSDTNNVLSYHQISGIHGLPCQSWGGVEGNQEAINQGGCGYCTHSSTLFPTWHRAYLALYEQAFYEQVKGVVSDFSGNPEWQSRLQAASTKFRIAYWDWAMGSGGVPSVLTQSRITVPAPRGGSQTIDNPLFSYKYQVYAEAVTGGSPWSGWDHTLKHPGQNSGGNNIAEMTGQLNAQFRNAQAQVYNVLLRCSGWNEMAVDSASTSTRDCPTSLESVHGLIHVLIGGDWGHMTYLDTAGFDPAFWLHHANIDRLLAIWQVAQGKWVESGPSGLATWTHTRDQIADGNYQLTPFYKSRNAFWTPNQLEDWTQFGYGYTELPQGLRSSRSQIISDINRLYGSQAVTPPPPASSSKPATSSTRAPSSSHAIGGPSSPPVVGPTSSRGIPPAPSSSAIGGPSPGFPGTGGNHSIPSIPNPGPSGSDDGPYVPQPSGYLPIPSGTYDLPSLPSYLPDLPSYLPDLLTPIGRKWDWAANIVAERMGLGGSFTVYVFLGKVPEDSSSWGTAKSLIGTFSIFASKRMTAESGSLVSGSVSLTATLVEQIMGGYLKGLDAVVVEPFLAKELTWAVKKCGGEVVPNDQVPGLVVEVVSSKVKPAPNKDSAPTYEVAEPHDDITNGNAGGAKPGSNPYNGSIPYKPSGGSYNPGPGADGGSASPGLGGSSGSGGYAPGLAQPSCIPNIKYEYVYVSV
jgi:tyrosinase